MRDHLVGAAIGALAFSGIDDRASAGDLYAVAGGGSVMMAGGENVGSMAPTGEGPAPSFIFDTRYADGIFLTAGYGKRSAYGPFRSELELSYTRQDVEKHTRPRLDGLDAGDLPGTDIFGAEAPPGPTVSQLLGDARGSIEAGTIMLNAYWDIPVGHDGVLPYLGAGVGGSYVDAEFQPGGTDFIDARDLVLSYQAMAGLQARLGEAHYLRAGVRYRATGDVEVDADVPTLGGTFELEMKQVIFEVGIRRDF
jgi:opacity protein-like surface antigen